MWCTLQVVRGEAVCSVRVVVFELCCSSCDVRVESLSLLNTHTYKHTHRYVAAVSERGKQIKRPPAMDVQDTPHFTHKGDKQVPWLCTVCREHVHGLVFQCVHCVDLALCLNCMETCLNCTDTSSLSSKIPTSHDPKRHVFNIRVPRMNPNLVDALCGSWEG